MDKLVNVPSKLKMVAQVVQISTSEPRVPHPTRQPPFTGKKGKTPFAFPSRDIVNELILN